MVDISDRAITELVSKLSRKMDIQQTGMTLELGFHRILVLVVVRGGKNKLSGRPGELRLRKL